MKDQLTLHRGGLKKLAFGLAQAVAEMDKALATQSHIQ